MQSHCKRSFLRRKASVDGMKRIANSVGGNLHVTYGFGLTYLYRVILKTDNGSM